VSGRTEHATSTAFVGGHPWRVLGLEAADLKAVLYGALLKDVGCGAVLAAFFASQGTGPRLDGLWLHGMAARTSRPRRRPWTSSNGFARPRLTVLVHRRIAGPGPHWPTSRAVSLPDGRQTWHSRDTVLVRGPLTSHADKGPVTAQRTRNTGVPGAYAVREE
jgi:hypothetical protein